MRPLWSANKHPHVLHGSLSLIPTAMESVDNLSGKWYTHHTKVIEFADNNFAQALDIFGRMADHYVNIVTF